MQSLLLISTNTITTIMYVLVAILLLGNILFLVLFIQSTAKCTGLENQLSARNKESISATEHDKNADQPVGARMEDEQEYSIIEAKESFNVAMKKTGEVVAVAKTKEEAKEIIKGLAQKN